MSKQSFGLYICAGILAAEETLLLLPCCSSGWGWAYVGLLTTVAVGSFRALSIYWVALYVASSKLPIVAGFTGDWPVLFWKAKFQ
jgi:hypothetical protein